MERSRALEIVEKQLTEKRYTHTLGVSEAAVELADRYGADVYKAELAAIFHDYAKFRPKEEMKQILIDEREDERLLAFHHELWHAPAGAVLVRREAGIEDEDILSAIRWHTTGKPGMTLLEKIIYLADYIEPGRAFPGVEEVRAIAKQSLNAAVLAAVKNSILFLMSKKQPVFPVTMDMYNDLIQNGDDV
ncbi:bis(5'-nucleosyl)-tetraphosphatase (symmetrical) YqeK [Domibacillus sp. DTU_2020_1001157_1_SI_ALB_TIR_016]|uniref:bis(5'-nucleosyl)-tetraphosphatase (symmetrical) YqeK n=1 Tax=Domibacillus sp. DTU_2020_1001157_1_SI_ALB_TIR_016 TaxID=3077789 RepID=UPI0028E9B392|nr:bis(5'-nucleosyl)-tetraphosphatase (symmetrical) YqeK [Domibacillus sp. DTU_2020_1001157_1_SI_ALB_TIR_016]WNS81894.1 bis(5'-nucleosyl)-tetraphosphatase (symmetrical) YqeK [Domibacillus sp. DTU_2020_1001157_1_SI_ALB_TIR_016]